VHHSKIGRRWKPGHVPYVSKAEVNSEHERLRRLCLPPFGTRPPVIHERPGPRARWKSSTVATCERAHAWQGQDHERTDFHLAFAMLGAKTMCVSEEDGGPGCALQGVAT
jgi:hypothetical protein